MRTMYRRTNQRGQVIIMVTLALFAMMGLLGLAVDFGWAAFLEKSTQNAAEAAALAAVVEGMESGTTLADYTCEGVVDCAASPVDCDDLVAGNLAVGCASALANGFDWTDTDTTVTMQAWDRSSDPTVHGCDPLVYHPPTAPCVDTYYWVTVRVAREVPQLFSRIWGNDMGLVSSRATAAVATDTTDASLILLNRENDVWDEASYPGTNLYNQGGPDVYVPGGIAMASADSTDAGYLWGNATVDAPFTWIRGGGDVALGGSAQWVEQPINNDSSNPSPDDGNPSLSPYYDPFYDVPQPPISPNLTARPVLGGHITDAVEGCEDGVCPPGIYYATAVPKSCTGTCLPEPTGEPVQIGGGDITFEGGGFDHDNFVFFGGLLVGQASVTFGEGIYVMAGVNAAQGYSNVLETDNKSFIVGGDSTTPDSGRMFLLTDDQYPGLAPALQSVFNESGTQMPTLSFGSVDVKAGNNEGSSISLQGLNRGDGSSLPLSLYPYSPVLMWQDRRNSNYAYVLSGDDEGKYAADSSLGEPACSGNVNAACTYEDAGIADGRGPVSPGMYLYANQYMDLWGAIYQPRGAWLTIWAGSDDTGPLQVVTGALRAQGGANLTLTGPPRPITRFVAALVE